MRDGFTSSGTRVVCRVGKNYPGNKLPGYPTGTRGSLNYVHIVDLSLSSHLCCAAELSLFATIPVV